MKKKVGLVIKTLRKQQELKQHYIAFKLGITVEAYANIENGRSDINTSKLYLISLILGIKASKMIKSAETKKPNKN